MRAEWNPSQVVQYTYDAFNQLIGRTLDPDGDQGSAAVEESVFVYDDGQIVLQFDRTGGSGELENADLSHRYLWSAAVDQLMADEQVVWTDGNSDDADDSATDNELLWALTDHLGSVRDVVDSTGALKNHIAYNSAGIVVSETNAAYGLLFGFTGRQFDDDTGLQNNLHRWYDAEVGKWISEDPIGFKAGDANLTRYVGNSFASEIDPSGLNPGVALPAVGIGGAEIGTAIAAGGPVTAAATCAVAGPYLGYRVGSAVENNLGWGASVGNWWWRLWNTAEWEEDDGSPRQERPRERPQGNNQTANQTFDQICKGLGLTPEQRRQLHDQISNQGLTPEEIRQLAEDMFPPSHGSNPPPLRIHPNPQRDPRLR